MATMTYADAYRFGKPDYEAYLRWLDSKMNWLSKVNPEYHYAITLEAAGMPKGWSYKSWATNMGVLKANKFRDAFPSSDDAPF